MRRPCRFCDAAYDEDGELWHETSCPRADVRPDPPLRELLADHHEPL